jgi:hypothetical protein
MTEAVEAHKPVTNVYIDGFNLYYRAVKGTRLKWLDLEVMCRLLLPDNVIQRIRYFTARVKPRPDDPQAPARQDAYLAALRSLPTVSIHYGHFLQTITRMRLASPPAPPAAQTAQVIKTEEKGSDVALATWLLVDAYETDCEMSVVITNDSDLCMPIRVVSQRLGIPVGLINPGSGQASRALLREKPVFVKSIRQGLLAASQFPDQVVAANRTVRRPASW